MLRMAPCLHITCILTAAAVFAGGVTVTLSNAAPRVDTGGAIIDAHDGTTFYHSQTKLYYQFAASYGNCKSSN